MADWKPIATAPKDGTHIVVWRSIAASDMRKMRGRSAPSHPIYWDKRG